MRLAPGLAFLGGGRESGSSPGSCRALLLLTVPWEPAAQSLLPGAEEVLLKQSSPKPFFLCPPELLSAWQPGGHPGGQRPSSQQGR